MKNPTLSILISIIILTPIAAFAQSIQNRIKTNPNSSDTVVDTNSASQNPSQADYESQLNHNDYRIPITPNAE